ncbi:MAG: hypothetical protein ABSA90_16100 [Xanthobacteraceae bacterium]
MPRHFGNLLFALALLGSSAAFGQGAPLPWGQRSDMLAWETFVQIVAPAGDQQNTNVEFETWASDEDIYAASPHWPSVGTAKQLQVSALGTVRHGVVVRPQIIAPSQCTQDYDKQVAQAAGFPADGCIGEEVRRNWATFQYIVSNKLYSRAGLAAAFQKGLKVDLPADAIEFKGDWVRVADVMKWLNLTEKQVDDLYYTNTATAGKTTTKFALVSFHFSTKQIKDWVWADFEHQKNPGRCDDIGCHDSFGATVPDVPPTTPLWQQYGECQKTAAVAAMFTNAGINPVWKNYCLKGSQITFVNSGTPTLLGNSVIEAINAGVPIAKSSCITCHAYASFDKAGDGNGAAAGANYTGNVDQTKLQGWATNDFLWGVLFAR